MNFDICRLMKKIDFSDMHFSCMKNIISSDMIFDILTLVRRDGWTSSLSAGSHIGFSGYVTWMGFDPVLPDVPFNHPSIVSNSIRFQ